MAATMVAMAVLASGNLAGTKIDQQSPKWLCDIIPLPWCKTAS